MTIDPTTVPHGCLTIGDTVEAGTIEAVSFTAYQIDGSWVPFAKVHGAYSPVAPLVIDAALVAEVHAHADAYRAESDRNVEAMVR